MIKEGAFGPAEAIILLTLSSIARIFLPYPRRLFEIGAQAAWMTPLGGLVIALAGVYIMSVILKKSPGKTIIEITEEILGPVAGSAINLIVVAFFVLVAALFTREFSEAMIIAALPSTPISVITTSYITVGLLGAYLGIEAMARTARLAYPYAVGGIALLLFAIIPQWDVDNLFPLFGNGPLQVFGAGTFGTAGVTEIILAGVLVQAMGGADKFSRIGYSSILISYGLLIALLITLTLSMHWTQAAETTLPFYTLSRNIYLGRFFQRVEAIFVIVWSIIGAFKIALSLYGASVSLARTLKLPDYRPLIWPMGLTIFITSLLPSDMPTAVKLDADFLIPLALVPSYLIPLLILAAYWFRGRGRRA